MLELTEVSQSQSRGQVIAPSGHRLPVFVLLAAVLSAAGCASPRSHALSVRTSTYEIKVLENRIFFKGIDDPEVVEDRPDDVWRETEKTGPFNKTRHERCLAAVEEALEILRRIAQTADTSSLINSIRGDGQSGITDYCMAQGGNWVLAEELCTREPLDDEDMKKLEWGFSLYMFRGSSQSGAFSPRSFLLEGRGRLMQRWEDLDKQRELKAVQPEGVLNSGAENMEE